MPRVNGSDPDLGGGNGVTSWRDQTRPGPRGGGSSSGDYKSVKRPTQWITRGCRDVVAVGARVSPGVRVCGWSTLRLPGIAQLSQLHPDRR